MNNCKQCNAVLEHTPGHREKVFCGDACRMAFYRASRTVKAEQIDSEQAIQNRSDIEPWKDPDIRCSDLYRRSQGKVSLPGDPGYSGVCQYRDGHWYAPSQLEAENE